MADIQGLSDEIINIFLEIKFFYKVTINMNKEIQKSDTYKGL
jgi:hypothetical protein